jgi:FMN phosphatase YigB (HAD superfamily)
VAAPPLKWVLFDWGGTLMSEEGPLDVPMALWPEVRAIPGALPTLQAFAGRCDVAIATNASVSTRDQILVALHRVGLDAFVSRVFCYRDLGVRKDDEAFWREVRRQLQVDDSEIVMVGDHLDQDVVAPRRFGIATVWFNEDARAQNPLSVEPTITQLPQLVALLHDRLPPRKDRP